MSLCDFCEPSGLEVCFAEGFLVFYNTVPAVVEFTSLTFTFGRSVNTLSFGLKIA